MGTLGTLLYLQKPVFTHKFNPTHFSSPSTLSKFHVFAAKRTHVYEKEIPIFPQFQLSPKTMGFFIGAAGITFLSFARTSNAAELPFLNEPSNALSIPTWAVHVSSVVEWATAMALVWQYGEKSGFESWKGLSWGMVPLLGGALCACTWHFFYNSESLELLGFFKNLFSMVEYKTNEFAVSKEHSDNLVLVAIQAALTVIGNATMCFAAYRVYMSSEERS